MTDILIVSSDNNAANTAWIKYWLICRSSFEQIWRYNLETIIISLKQGDCEAQHSDCVQKVSAKLDGLLISPCKCHFGLTLQISQKDVLCHHPHTKIPSWTWTSDSFLQMMPSAPPSLTAKNAKLVLNIRFHEGRFAEETLHV